MMMLEFLASVSEVFIHSKAKCLKAGGEWGSWTKYEGAKNISTCRIRAKDSGKPCGDERECSTGLCEYNSETKLGACFSFRNTGGCHTWMKNGRPQSVLCKD
jgi:hypothetical protein